MLENETCDYCFVPERPIDDESGRAGYHDITEFDGDTAARKSDRKSVSGCEMESRSDDDERGDGEGGTDENLF